MSTDIAPVKPTRWDWLRPDLGKIIELIREGATYREIAKLYNVSSSDISDFLNLPEHSDQSARALLFSAESWLDRGLEPLESALDKTSGTDPTAAKAYEQACARRAGLRNPKYRDKIDANHTGGLTVQIVRFSDGDEPV
jgi:hypothetical protein